MDHVDWQLNKTPLQCTEYMLEHEIDCDVNFKVGEDQESIKAHKFIVSMRSPVFQKMLNGPYIEALKDPVIPDVDPEAFRALLRYCYYESIDIREGDALAILCASKKYMLPLLEIASRKKLIQSLSASNIWESYTYAISVGDTELHAGCKSYFQDYVKVAREALNTEAFLKISHEVLLDLLQINNNSGKAVTIKDGIQYYKNDFGIHISEIELFKVCDAWAAAECLRQKIDPNGPNKRKMLGDCLFLLRFPTMIFKELVKVVFPTGILTQTEKDNLCQYEQSEAGSKCQVDFPSSDRQFMVVTTEYTTECESDDHTGTAFLEPEERIMLTKIWCDFARYRVTVKNEQSESSWSKVCNAKYQNDPIIGSYAENLYFLDLDRQVLEACGKYSVTIVKTGDDVEEDEEDDEYDSDCDGNLVLEKLAPFKGVKVTTDPEPGDHIYALELSFV